MLGETEMPSLPNSSAMVVVVRRDGLTPGELRTLAIATRDAMGSGIVGLLGLDGEGAKAGLAVAVSKDRVDGGASAAAIARDAAKIGRAHV